MKLPLSIVLLVVGSIGASSAQQQTATSGEVFIGNLSTLSHGVSGKVYAIDEKTIRIRDLNYDGQAPDAYFWVGNTDKPGVNGRPIPNEKGSTKPLKAYRNADVVLRLPGTMTLRDIKHIGLWCRKFQVNFGFTPVNLV